MNRIEALENEIHPLIEKLNQHDIYKAVDNISDVKLFMESHVFAVWDFMSLLKALQIEFTCVQLPWLPSKDNKITRFINEIVLDEESDIDEEGNNVSHFEMYYHAMKDLGCNTSQIDSLISEVSKGEDVNTAIDKLNIHPGVKKFVHHTFRVVNSKKPHAIASAFTFGREDIIPEMFMNILNNQEDKKFKSDKLKFYLKRHIELDGDNHGPLALKMIESLCGDDENRWEEVLLTAKESIQSRIELWDAVLEELKLVTQ